MEGNVEQVKICKCDKMTIIFLKNIQNRTVMEILGPFFQLLAFILKS